MPFVRHFYSTVFNAMVEQTVKKYSGRICVQISNTYFSIPITDIACIYRIGVLTTIVSAEHGKFVCYESLSDLEEKLNPSIFFRANRQFIISVHFIRSFSTFERVKLVVKLSFDFDQKIIVSQEKSSVFKKWINEEF